MPEAVQPRIVKLVVTSRGLEPARHLRSALRAAISGARVRSTGFRGVFAVEAEGDPAELATFVWDECSEKIGHVTAVLAMVESRKEAIKDAASRFGAAQIGPEESFCFRLHKRGAHGLEQDTSKLEREIGAAIWAALEEKYSKKPRVTLKNPDITVVAEILGPLAAVGISRISWRGSVSLSGMVEIASVMSPKKRSDHC
jgi:tRNA(Ser,Leu) C12 N-acetylase TAN1